MRLFVALGAAASLSACATFEPPVTTAPAPEAMVEISAGRQAALIVNVGGDLNCEYSLIGINRRGAETNQVITTVQESGFETSGPALIAVEPGRYALNRGSCMRAGYYPAEFPNLNRWFGYVDVEAGEIVYLGTLNAQLVDFTTRSAFDSEFARFWLEAPGATETSYVYYTLDNNPEVVSRITAAHPELSDRIIFRAPPQRISNDLFVSLLKEAYAPDANGVRPTREEAMERFKAALDRAVPEAPAKTAGK